MGYLGGKSKGAEHIIRFLNNPKFDGMTYIEPFVGYANILRRVKNKRRYVASDVNPYLITLLKYVQKSTKYPTITKEQYEKFRETPFSKLSAENKVKASFAAFTYSYGGKMWGGYYPSGSGRNYAAEHKRYYRKLYDNEVFKKTHFFRKSYKAYNPKGALIYCDPPYAGTTGYRGTGSWDAKEFWDTVRKWSKNNIVVVSEYKAPKDFKCISYVVKKSTLHVDRVGGGKDCLFIHKSLLDKI